MLMSHHDCQIDSRKKGKRGEGRPASLFASAAAFPERGGTFAVSRAPGAGLPQVPAAVLAPDGGSPFPPFPETRASTLLRHKQALERVFARIAKDNADEEGTVLVVGHGASNDFILYALCGEEAHPTGRYASDEVEPLPPPPHCCLTTIVKNGQGVWEVESYGQPTVSTSHANSAATTPKL